ncbi:Rad52/Rad22 family DNA repair protein [Nocardiopsis sp. NPDC057823]|uniref:Rad52/Rad22 family DNA repair protein n=1 Tax=Nocardiopsis sp. NPDC057823 TaxID=3346256 RepID=UPI0036709459
MSRTSKSPGAPGAKGGEGLLGETRPKTLPASGPQAGPEAAVHPGPGPATPLIAAGPSSLTEHQLGQLFKPIDPARVALHRGNAHLQGWDVRRSLTRIFGFGGWSPQTLQLTCLRDFARMVPATEKSEGGTRFWATYLAQVRLTVRTIDGRTLAFYDDAAVEEASKQVTHGAAHDLAVKAALTGALKRCAVNLGDQFGISLYRKGPDDLKAQASVIWSVAHPPKDMRVTEQTGPVDVPTNEEDSLLVDALFRAIAEARDPATLNEISRRVNEEARAGLAPEWVDELKGALKLRLVNLTREPTPDQIAAAQDAAAEAPQDVPSHHHRGGRRA